MNEKLKDYCMWMNLVFFILIGFLYKYIWLLAILQAYYVGKIEANEGYKKRRLERRLKEKEKYLKKFRILKLTIGEWVAIIIFILIIVGLILLYI